MAQHIGAPKDLNQPKFSHNSLKTETQRLRKSVSLVWSCPKHYLSVQMFWGNLVLAVSKVVALPKAGSCQDCEDTE